MKPEGYSIIIDTNSYAGNFEREMCAYITGEVGDCSVGKEYATKALQQIDGEILLWFQDFVASVPDEHGCCRPVAITTSSNSKNKYHSFEIFFYEKPPNNIIEVVKDRAQKYGLMNNIKILGFRLIETVVNEIEELI